MLTSAAIADAADDLDLDDDVRADACRILVQRVNSAVLGASQRDADLMEFDDQLAGRQYPMGQPWPNACTLNDPLTREAHLQLVSTMMQAAKGTQIWTVEAVNDADEDKASKQEEWLNDRWAEYKLSRINYQLAYNAAGRDDTAVLYMGWQQRVRQVQDTMYRHVGKSEFTEPDEDDDEDTEASQSDSVPSSSGLVYADERRKGHDYEPVDVERPDVEHEGCVFRVVSLPDFYLYPANAQSIDSAHGVAERMLLSEDDLLDGIEDFGWDEDAILDLIKAGATHTQGEDGSYRERKDEYRGKDGAVADNADGYYACFLYFGKLPKMRDGDGELGIPDDLVRADIMAMICPAHNAVFHLTRSPYKQRPYIPFGLLPDPDSFEGTGGCRLLANIQDEANMLLQNGMNSLNLTMMPVYKASESWLSHYGDKFRFYPGAILPTETEGDLMPLGHAGDVNQGFEVQQELVQRGKGLIAAEGYGQLDQKQRKNGEMQNVLQATDAKFDLFMTNFAQGWEEVAPRMVALHLQFGGENGQWDFRDNRKQTQTISGDDMRGQFRYHVSSTASTSSPEMKLNIAEKVQSVTMQFWVAALQSPPQVVPFLWHTTREVLLRMDVRSPEQCIGPDPAQQANNFTQNVPQQVATLVQQGMPVQQALAIVQAQNGVAQAPGAGGTPPMPGIAQLAQAGQQPMGQGAAA